MISRRLWPWPKSTPQGFRDLLSSSLWLVLAAGLAQGSMLVATVLVANSLGVASYGRYALLQTTTLLLASLAQISFGVVIAQQLASLRQTNPDKAGEVAAFCFGVTFFLGFLFSAAIFFGRDEMSSTVFRDPELSDGLLAVAFAIPWVAGAAVQQGLFTGLERFRDQAIISIVLIPLVVGLPVLGALETGFAGAMVGLGLTYFLRFAVSQVVVMRLFRRAGLRWSFGGLKANVAMIWRFALPATLAGVLISLAIWGGQTILVRSQGGATTLGLFAAAYIVKTIVMFVPTQMIVALLPLLSRIYAVPTGGDPRRLLWLNTAGGVLLTLVLAIVVVAVAPQILALFGEEFRAGSAVLVVLMLATPLEAATISLYQDMQAKGRFWRAMLFVNLPVAATVLVLTAYLVPSQQADGLALAWLLGWAVGLAGTIAALWNTNRPAVRRAHNEPRQTQT